MKIQVLEKTVNAANDLVRLVEELDYRYDHFNGIAILDNVGVNCVLVSSNVDGTELFPDNFEVGFLQTNAFVPPNQRFFTVEQRAAKGKKISIDFKDGGSANAYPYVLRIYLRLKND